MVGPDTKHTSTEFAARYSAMQKIINAWNRGGKPAVAELVASQPDHSTLEALAREKLLTRETLQEIHWIKRYAGDLERKTINPVAHINYLANCPRPIAPFRTN
jgi:hypothetical protein